MLNKQNQGPQCTACGSPMRLTAIEPSMWGRDLRSFSCPLSSLQEGSAARHPKQRNRALAGAKEPRQQVIDDLGEDDLGENYLRLHAFAEAARLMDGSRQQVAHSHTHQIVPRHHHNIADFHFISHHQST